MNKRIARLALMLLAFTMVGAARAMPLPEPVLLDPDGKGPLDAIGIDTWDWAFGNVLAQGGNTALENWISNEAGGGPHGGSDEKFMTLGQARLNALKLDDKDVTTDNIKGGSSGGTAEFTMVFKFPEVVADFDGSKTEFFYDIAANPVLDTFFEVYYQDEENYGVARDANNLAGTGFNNGVLVLEGTVRIDGGIGPFGSDFESTGGGSGTPLDGFVFDEWPNTDSVTGSGSRDDVDILVEVTSVNREFIKSSIGSMILQNAAQSLNFVSVDPSRQFTDVAGGGVPNVTPVIGSINGARVASGGGADIMYQIDPVSTTRAGVPEPSILFLMGLGGLGLIGGLNRRRDLSA